MGCLHNDKFIILSHKRRRNRRTLNQKERAHQTERIKQEKGASFIELQGKKINPMTAFGGV